MMLKQGMARAESANGVPIMWAKSTLKSSCTLDAWVEHIVHIDGVTGSSPVATTKIPGNTAFSGISSCPAEAKNALETGLLWPSHLVAVVLAFAKIRTIEYKVI